MGQRVRRELYERKKSLDEQAATVALRRLRNFRLELAELAVNADEVKVEASFGEREAEYDEKRRARDVGDTEVRAGAGESVWEVDDERWIDEEDGYVTRRASACPLPEAEPAPAPRQTEKTEKTERK